MVKFILSRLVIGILVLVSVILLISSIIYLAPVDPTRLTFGQRSDTATIEAKKRELGLDKSLTKQLVLYLSDISPIYLGKKNDRFAEHEYLDASIIHFKKPYLRSSYQTGREVSVIMSQAIPKTMILALTSFLIAAFFGILFGIIAAIKKDGWIDNFILTITTLGISVPSYVAAVFLALMFGYVWRNFTGLNVQGSIFELNDIGDNVVVWKNLILPAIALGIRPIAIVTQLTRSAMLDVLHQNYITTAKAKGLASIRIIMKHALRNTMNPVVTSLTGWLASLLTGAYFVEKVFNFKGVGELTINALVNYDIPVILASVLFICTVFIVINIITDLAYLLIDPKLR